MKVDHVRSAAFSLVEVTLALGVAGFALLAIFGLLPVGINSDQAAIAQSAATNIGTEIIADLHEAPSASDVAVTPALGSKSPKYKIDATVANATTLYLDDSGTAMSVVTSAKYKAVVLLTPPVAVPPATAVPRTATMGTIVVSWPPAATTPLGSISLFVSLDRN